jgi:predicted TIM-barrel fold metal-dependent hydrolase
LIAARQRVVEQRGESFPSWVLDKLNIQYMLANRQAMGAGLPPSRFLWVPYDDALLVPFPSQALANTPDRKFFYKREQELLDRYLADLHITHLPATLDEYVSGIVIPTLERQKKAGAVAIKFEAAYLRSLDFGKQAPPTAAALYAKFARGGPPDHDEYLQLQNALFRRIVLEAGRLKLPVHIHTGNGCGGYFYLSGSNPLLLDPILNDATLRQTTFVLIHGGAGPFTWEAAFQIGKPNVYLDFSEQDWFLSARSLSLILRDYLEAQPEKVLFGTDLFPGPPEMDWDATGWMINATAREALAMALTSMVRDKEITRERALELARMVMRENAMKLYGLK